MGSPDTPRIPTARPSWAAPPLGVVLAGGAAKRLGGSKASVELAGRPLISYPLDALAQAGLEAVVVAKAGSPLPPLSHTVITEPDEPRHPLAGITSAMTHAGARPVLTLACDTPFLTPMLLRVLASATTTTAVRSEGRLHPLIALYAPDALTPLEGALAEQKSLTAALEALEPEIIEAPTHETFNVNTPEDLAEAEAHLRQARP